MSKSASMKKTVLPLLNQYQGFSGGVVITMSKTPEVGGGKMHQFLNYQRRTNEFSQKYYKYKNIHNSLLNKEIRYYDMKINTDLRMIKHILRNPNFIETIKDIADYGYWLIAVSLSSKMFEICPFKNDFNIVKSAIKRYPDLFIDKNMPKFSFEEMQELCNINIKFYNYIQNPPIELSQYVHENLFHDIFYDRYNVNYNKINNQILDSIIIFYSRKSPGWIDRQKNEIINRIRILLQYDNINSYYLAKLEYLCPEIVRKHRNYRLAGSILDTISEYSS